MTEQSSCSQLLQKRLDTIIVFERELGHCLVELIQAASLRDALVLYASKIFSAKANDEGFLTLDRSAINPHYLHPLEFIETNCKSSLRYDELQYDVKSERIINNSSWQIRTLSELAWQANFAEVFCSSEPWSLGEYIRLCRSVLRFQFPHSRTRAFVWYLNDGPLVTFYRKKSSDESIEIIKRFIIPWQRQNYPNPYTMASSMVQEWQGTYDDLLAQMRIDYPF